MAGKAYYPIFLDLHSQYVVVVGAGKVGLRKVRGLLAAGAHVRVIAPRFDAGFDELDAERLERPYRSGDLAGAVLAFAATDVRDVNRQVTEDARAAGIPVNVADAPAECGFVVPARATVEGLQVAVSTGGADPAQAARVRDQIAEFLRGIS